jgi:hypothetical protein
MITLSIEHRAAASIAPMSLRLETSNADRIALTIQTPEQAKQAEQVAMQPVLPLGQRVLEHLATAAAPQKAIDLRKHFKVRNETMHDALTSLVATNQIRKDRSGGYSALSAARA